mmetsp:Transcript_3586/g.3078  ORF Transcript_3586/g.3078 Transcript_3586/m.3078 type:complete len:108 (+) Transcript_3586:70-393(+)
MTPNGANTSIQTPFGDDIIIEAGDGDGNGDKSPFDMINTGRDGEFHINLNEDDEVGDINADIGESEEYDDDDDILIEDGGITIGMIDDENDNDDDDMDIFNAIDTAE